ncbi:cytochrome P450 [Phanerochaete sordida]|uniref:Cytochrome P450 n=1 Tax=Phanerochaete sordida TaxID=48140 RepID=A0A9P3LIQ3_9APHY|nr:cytochrome P450 [Phanerochaete sordida]
MALGNGVLAVLFLVSVAIAAYGVKQGRKAGKLPPGPSGLPIAGMAFENAKGYQWLNYEKWGKQYGSDILHVHMFGKPMIVLNSMQAVNDLFEKRSNLYSDREQQTMFHKLVGWDWNLAFMPYGDRWKEHRRMFHQHFQPSVVPKYRAKLALETRKFIGRLRHTATDDWLRHVRHLTGAIIIGVTYGLDVQQENDPNVLLAEKAIFSMAMTGVAGTYLVDWLPQMQFLPEWFPGAKFLREAREWRPAVETMSKVPFDDVKAQLAAGKAKPSVVSTLLTGLDDTKDNTLQELVIQNTAGTAYTGGADTTVSALGTFILAMVQNPEVQQKAQAELDRVVGNQRLPDYDDQANLPYFAALMKEVLRWRPVTPLAASHKVMEDDEYKGYHIPGGAIVMGNVWAILHDEKVFPDHDKFDPTRFLTADGKELRKDIMEPEIAAFGFGRRKCPGRYLAMDSLWIAMAYLLQCYNIKAPIDQYGNPIEPDGKYTTGLLSYPLPFPVNFEPRSPEAIYLLEHLSMDE